MNAQPHAQAAIPNTLRPTPVRHGASAPADHAERHTAPQRLSVWDERARKMGFPPSTR